MKGARLRISILASLLLCVLITPPSVQADFESAAEFYRQKDYRAALEAFKILSNTDDPRAQTVLAMMYKYGEGTPQDLAKALQWYESAAKHGYALAQFHAGNMYAEGLGTVPDQDRALLWLTLASDQGFDAASHKLDELREANRDPQEVIPWSQDWDFRLPKTFQLSKIPQVSTQKTRYRAQVGAMRSHDAAVKLWELLQKNQSELFYPLVPRISHGQNMTRSIYRIQVGPFSTRDDASRFCAELLSHPVNAGCLPIKVL